MNAYFFMNNFGIALREYQKKYNIETDPIIFNNGSGWYLCKSVKKEKGIKIYEKPYMRLPATLNKFLINEGEIGND